MRNFEIVATVSRSDFTVPDYTLRFEHLPVTIGAAIDNDIVLDAPQVSARHAQIAMSRGALLIQNSSRNGTFIAGERVEQKQLHDSDVVSIPPFQIRFRVTTRGTIADGPTEVADLPSKTPPQPAALLSRAPSKLYSVEVVTGPRAVSGKSFQLPATGLRIGRSSSAGLSIDCPTLSRLHAEIRSSNGSDWTISDLKSANGTFVNGSRVEHASLRTGDEIVLGEDVVLRFVVEYDPKQPAAAPPAAPASQGRSRFEADATLKASTVIEEPLPVQAPHQLPTPRTPARPQPSAQDSTPPLHNGASPQRRALKIHSRRATWNKKVLVLTLEGWIDGYNYTELGSAFDRIVDAGERRVVLDLAALAFIDHTGLAVLMKAITAMERYGGDFRLVSASQRLLDAFSLAHLDSFLKGRILKDEAAAQRELAGWRG